MFQTAPGVTIPCPEKIKEEYRVFDGISIRANISFEKLKPLVEEFYQALPEPLFLVLQLPLAFDQERKIGPEGCLHQEVLYLDGQTRPQIDDIMRAFGPVLLGDGSSQFGIASHQSREEVFIQKYKLTDFYSAAPRKFIPLLEKYGLSQTQDLITVWDTFSPETPGECRLIAIDGLDVYAVAEELKKMGLYRAKIIEV